MRAEERWRGIRREGDREKYRKRKRGEEERPGERVSVEETLREGAVRYGEGAGRSGAEVRDRPWRESDEVKEKETSENMIDREKKRQRGFSQVDENKLCFQKIGVEKRRQLLTKQEELGCQVRDVIKRGSPRKAFQRTEMKTWDMSLVRWHDKRSAPTQPSRPVQYPWASKCTSAILCDDGKTASSRALT
ncbi:hypothetical protein NDU88_000925 [Pleurodeles waltl]|uniref:Uncharacterized protein n=1 Tax=Pleurodeles waltl TaxID=8319 RepID=A0AAV7MM88_PLEWA|nr:hypothetical protein NDU88_000925 [Pleurodeles waltl]